MHWSHHITNNGLNLHKDFIIHWLIFFKFLPTRTAQKYRQLKNQSDYRQSASKLYTTVRKSYFLWQFKFLFNFPFLDSNSTKRYDRGCRVNLSGGTDFCADLTKQNKEAECEICDEDSCNSAIKSDLFKSWMLIISLVLSAVIKCV